MKILSNSPRAVAVAPKGIAAINSAAAGSSSAKGSQVIVSYSFDDANGASSTFDGEKVTANGKENYRFGMFGKKKPEALGQLVTVAKEDDSWTGPDGKPGVFSVLIAELPESLNFVGFSLLGKSGTDRVSIRSWTLGQTTAKELDKTTLEFRHRLARALDSPKNPLKFNVRLEPAAAADPHGKSIRLASFEATDEWRTHSIKLSKSENQEVFLDHINSAKTNNVQVTFDFASQKELLVGDMILLDDIKFLAD